MCNYPASAILPKKSRSRSRTTAKDLRVVARFDAAVAALQRMGVKNGDIAYTSFPHPPGNWDVKALCLTLHEEEGFLTKVLEEMGVTIC